MATMTLVRPPQSRQSKSRPAAATGADRLMLGARLALAEAAAAADAGERYAAAHLAALRAAAAMLAHRAQPTVTRSRRPTSVWALLTSVAPDLAEWAAYFAAGANKRVAAQSGMRGVVSTREADDLLRDVTEFLGLVESGLGMLPIGGLDAPLI